MVSPILPFAVGALMSRNEIVDRQDELTGQIVDTVSENYFAKSSEEKARLKNVDKIYEQLSRQYPTQVVEAFAHAGFLDSGDLGTAMGFIQNVKPEAIEQLKTMDSADLNLVFQNNNSKILESVGSKENAVASNLNRGQLKNLSDLYFKDNFNKAKKEGTFDTARNLLFGGPIIKEGDVAPALLGLERETDKITPDLEQPDENLLASFLDIPGGPLISQASGTGTGYNDSEFRLRQNSASDVALGGLGLGGKYRTDANGDLQLVDYNEADGSVFTYAQFLVGNLFSQNPDSAFNNYRTVGTYVANKVEQDLRFINSSIQKYKADGTLAQDTTKDLQLAPIKGKDIDEKSYRFWVSKNIELLVTYAKSDYAYRFLVDQKYGGGAYKLWFDKYLEEALEASKKGSD